jgi:diacylglycerol kinase (ATP)
MNKKMCNYFSFGVDSRIGFGFDKNRTTSVLGNKCVYCWEGFKKMFIRTAKIKDVVESFNVE